MTDSNEKALMFASINAPHAGHAIDAHAWPKLAGNISGVDLAFANPPYIIDPAERTYRHGGGMNGAETSIVITRDALSVLTRDGWFILYSGSAIVRGRDGLKVELKALAKEHELRLR